MHDMSAAEAGGKLGGYRDVRAAPLHPPFMPRHLAFFPGSDLLPLIIT